MIAVIADDFTGAAEIGGIAVRQGFKAIIETALDGSLYDTDILIIATNTRAEAPEQATETINLLTTQLMAMQPTFIFKKIDSVLRGNVGAELIAQMLASNKRRALIVPANPALNRIIKDGIYYYNGVPLNRASFMAMASTEKTSAHVIDLIGEPAAKETVVISKDEQLPLSGFAIGNTVDENDLTYWAEKLDQKTIAAGGSSFFHAVLKKESRGSRHSHHGTPLLGKYKLFVCGSAFENSRKVVQAAEQNGQLVCYMPSTLFSSDVDEKQLIQHWKKDVVQGLVATGTVIIAVKEIAAHALTDLSAAIGRAMAQVVAEVMKEITVSELAIEGGSTAAAIIEKLNYTQFYPVQEFATGVIRMKVKENKNVFVTLKPGSYQWPESLWTIKTKMKNS